MGWLVAIPVSCRSKGQKVSFSLSSLPILVEISGSSCNESQAVGEFEKAFPYVDKSPSVGPGLSGGKIGSRRISEMYVKYMS